VAVFIKIELIETTDLIIISKLMKKEEDGERPLGKMAPGGRFPD
jgi:hypothetical protein